VLQEAVMLERLSTLGEARARVFMTRGNGKGLSDWMRKTMTKRLHTELIHEGQYAAEGGDPL